MKKKVCLIFLCALIGLAGGVTVAYYNTERIGFDSEARVITYDNEKISVMNREIYYKDVVEICDKITRIMPEKIVNI